MGRTGIRHQGNLSCFFDGVREFSLMPGTVSVYAPGYDFAPFGDKVTQGADFLVVDYEAFISAKPAYFLPGEYSFFGWHYNSS
jgi:hypothetical protein